MTIQELYDSSIKSLPTVERLQLATLILNEIPPQSVIDYGEEGVTKTWPTRRGTVGSTSRRPSAPRKKMAKPGDVVTMDFAGAKVTLPPLHLPQWSAD